MKKLLVGFLALSTVTAFAKESCVVAFEFNAKDGAYSSSLLRKGTGRRIKKIMESKGYKIVTKSDGSEDFELGVSADRHIGCGYSASVATLRDNLGVDSGYSVGFKVANGNDVFQKQGSFSRLFFNLPALKTRRALIRAVKQIPSCESI